MASLSEITELERALEALRLKFERYFGGLDRVPPLAERDRLIGAVRRLVPGHNTSVRFRHQNLMQKAVTLQNYWNRVLREIEDGRYHRDRFKADLRERSRLEGEQTPADALEGAPDDTLNEATSAVAREALRAATREAAEDFLDALKTGPVVQMRGRSKRSSSDVSGARPLPGGQGSGARPLPRAETSGARPLPTETGRTSRPHQPVSRSHTPISRPHPPVSRPQPPARPEREGSRVTPDHIATASLDAEGSLDISVDESVFTQPDGRRPTREPVWPEGQPASSNGAAGVGGSNRGFGPNSPTRAGIAVTPPAGRERPTPPARKPVSRPQTAHRPAARPPLPDVNSERSAQRPVSSAPQARPEAPSRPARTQRRSAPAEEAPRPGIRPAPPPAGAANSAPVISMRGRPIRERNERS